MLRVCVETQTFVFMEYFQKNRFPMARDRKVNLSSRHRRDNYMQLVTLYEDDILPLFLCLLISSSFRRYNCLSVRRKHLLYKMCIALTAPEMSCKKGWAVFTFTCTVIYRVIAHCTCFAYCAD